MYKYNKSGLIKATSKKTLIIQTYQILVSHWNNKNVQIIFQEKGKILQLIYDIAKVIIKNNDKKVQVGSIKRNILFL